MSFLDYLEAHRGHYIDHRVTPPTRPSVSAADLDPAAIDDDAGTTGGGPNPLRSRRRRARAGQRAARYRHVRPAFAPSAFSDPLPYEETWERAFR